MTASMAMFLGIRRRRESGAGIKRMIHNEQRRLMRHKAALPPSHCALWRAGSRAHSKTLTRRHKLREVLECCAIARLLAASNERHSSRLLIGFVALLAAFSIQFGACAAEIFRVASYNVENYIDVQEGDRRVKSPEARAKVRESIRAMKPDVLALEEIGGARALLELQTSLKKDGFDLPYAELVPGHDTNIEVAVLSKFPFVARHPHTNETFLLAGRRFHVSRGIVDVDIRVNAGYSFTLLAAHLKSQLASVAADESDLRLEEAKIFRRIIEEHLSANPRAHLIAVGDFNDLPDSAPVKAILGLRGRMGLTDTRPAERSGDVGGGRTVAWTHYYAKDDTYSRLDYILVSAGMSAEWVPRETYVLALPGWGTASDHRPIVAGFSVENP
jgi:endonuclease/exonuclease/phosphatase family metal-dependent hydrolase